MSEPMTVTRITIELQINDEGHSELVFHAENAEGEVPTLLEMYGLLKMAEGCAEKAVEPEGVDE